MSAGAPTCSICNARETTGFNYGVLCCDACKMFFRRTLFVKNINSCHRLGECIRKCRSCRFQKCIQAGMVFTPTKNTLEPTNNDQLSAFLFNLAHQEELRKYQLVNCWYDGDPTIAEIAEQNAPIKFTKRPDGFPMNLGEWIFITGLTSLNYLKKFNHVNMLNASDRHFLLKYSFYEISIFTDSMRACERKEESITFPDGSDIISEAVPGLEMSFLNGIRCRLAARVNDLKMTKEEFLLLSAVFFCNPGFPGISKSGCDILSTYQKIYSSALLQYCLVTYQKAGPTRFTDLLAVFQVIIKMRQDLSYLSTFLSICGFAVTKKKLYNC
ncbi:Nuclear receptor domain-containing protein [Caenorhabditis elegans]|uniref:Nuclear receptor domain-containing protein n=1 Tax=Caenorhabditis elegans TaxID=6239 RepID=Q7YWS6_CAEEL|nr:Nuclear receptor domain-containing protein [Caenorhabditis elegans]CAE17968.1 Nuclear receptor domain-containing protein [Caenorhabditis elegans]|eukprot:NP_001024160.1 Nuclear Hormone Receptor family [Caenorhabditis elegans]